MPSPIQAYLDALHAELRGVDEGALANYIPELARANPDAFGICLVTMDGTAYGAGDLDEPFTIQSVSKAFVYAACLADRGPEAVARKVGVEPSGEAFNSISLDPRTGAPFNPMINAGAIAATSLVAGATPGDQWARIAGTLADFAGRELAVDESVFRSESETGHRNRAIAWMLRNAGIVEGDPMASLENYFRQCSVLVTCRDLAFMAATLARGGAHPATGRRAMPAEHVERVLAVMATCGMYDYAGSWLYEVGMPAKSGVGGGIVAVLPGRFGIGVFSPRLDAKGNSVRGILACKRLSREFGLNLFTAGGDPSMAVGRVYTAADAPSRRQLPPALQESLREQAHRIRIVALHGYLDVAGMESVIRCLRSLAPQSDSFILDLHRVDGLADAAARLLNRARLGFAEAGIALVFTRIHGRATIEGTLGRAASKDDRGFLSFEDNDLAAEWCENRLLGDAILAIRREAALADVPLFRGLPAELLDEVRRASELRLYGSGATIVTCGEAGDGRVFAIAAGQASVLVPLADGAHQRVTTLGPGAAFGEMVLLGQTTRSATVVADTEVRCHVIESRELERISGREPRLKITLLENLATELAATVRRTTRWIAALA